MNKNMLVIIAAILTIGLIAFFFLKTASHQTGAIVTTGIIEGTEVNIAAKLSGRIAEICCREGDRVTSGQQVMTLENEDLTASRNQAAAAVDKAEAEVIIAWAAIENARANGQSAAADIATARADLLRFQAGEEDAGRHLKRITKLYRQESVARETYDSAVTAYDMARAETHAARTRIDSARARQNAAQAQLRMTQSQQQSAEAGVREARAELQFSLARLADTIITSPLAGTVVNRVVEKGETITAGVTALTIVDLGSLYARVDLDEKMISDLALDNEAVIRAEGLPGRVFQGKVTDIGRYAEFATQRDVIRGRQDIKTFRVKITLTDNEGLLKPGMTVDVEIRERTADDPEKHRR
ncbi:MAG: efflux RND transporter periplasmic adaptor subunit [Proteobacteria bacterium]|nr:efflux RND transporter periplasmic adaptor subunit [Pseudomonadota bacterium]MBU4294536.1 efflux RND transporter periplasmic adaptor subunit [Pseudomonadota bacterium]MCG2747072.1 efflux RND transporter periplasmic adaptor subunit [Desulfobulbaceae bacterium]